MMSWQNSTRFSILNLYNLINLIKIFRLQYLGVERVAFPKIKSSLGYLKKSYKKIESGKKISMSFY